MKNKLILLIVGVVAMFTLSAAAITPTAQAAQFYDIHMYDYYGPQWGQPPQIGKNRTYWSDTVYQRLDTYFRLDRCLPWNARLQISFLSTSGWQHGVRYSAFGACDIYQPADSHGPSRVGIRIEYWVTPYWPVKTVPEPECQVSWSCSPYYYLMQAYSLSDTGGGCGGGNVCL